MSKVLEKVERRLGEKLLIKGDRCAGPKCAYVRRASPPGVHSKGRGRRKSASEYGVLLAEKQKIRFLYGLDNSEVESYSKKAVLKPGVFSSIFTQLLERRLDNVVYRLGFAESRRAARQMVNHGHIKVNEKKITLPSYQVRIGDIISLGEKLGASSLSSNIDNKLKRYETAGWLDLDKNKKEGKVLAMPSEDELQMRIDIMKVKEFYSR